MRVALRSAGAEGQPQLGAGDVPGEPGEVLVRERGAVLALAGPDYQPLGRLGPGAARALGLAADQDDFEATLAGAGGVAQQLRLPGRAGQRDDAVDLVEHHAHRLRVELAEDEDRGVLGGQLVGGGQRAGDRESPVEHRHGLRCGASGRGGEPGSRSLTDGPARRPTSSPRCFAARRTLARSMRSRCVWMTFRRIWG